MSEDETTVAMTFASQDAALAGVHVVDLKRPSLHTHYLGMDAIHGFSRNRRYLVGSSTNGPASSGPQLARLDLRSGETLYFDAGGRVGRRDSDKNLTAPAVISAEGSFLFFISDDPGLSN